MSIIRIALVFLFKVCCVASFATIWLSKEYQFGDRSLDVFNLDCSKATGGSGRALMCTSTTPIVSWINESMEVRAISGLIIASNGSVHDSLFSGNAHDVSITTLDGQLLTNVTIATGCNLKGEYDSDCANWTIDTGSSLYAYGVQGGNGSEWLFAANTASCNADIPLRIYCIDLTTTAAPTLFPTTFPTITPTTNAPSTSPTITPTTTAPSSSFPTTFPTITPTTSAPSTFPTITPTTTAPSLNTSISPTIAPSASSPTLTASITPSIAPSPNISGSVAPTIAPSPNTSIAPTITPTTVPSSNTSTAPTLTPTTVPSSIAPTITPTTVPSPNTSIVPTITPTTVPSPTTTAPSSDETRSPSSHSTLVPSPENTSSSPSRIPTKAPTRIPTSSPSMIPTSARPSAVPSNTSDAEITVYQTFSSTQETTIVYAPNNITITISPDEAYGLQNGSFTITTKPITTRTVSSVVTIVFYDGDNNEKAISHLKNPIVFTLPLIAGASTPLQACLHELPILITPQCTWFDEIKGAWTESGCLTKLSRNVVECSCTHLTDFAAVVPDFNRVPPQQVLQLTPANVARYPGGIITIMTVITLFVVIFMFSVRRDVQEKRREELKTKKYEKWAKDIARLSNLSLRKQCWKQYKAGLQTYHTWGSLLFRKCGTSFRSVDRAFVALMMLLTVMSMSARFHARDQTPIHRGEIIIYSILASLLPSLLLTHLFTHTGEMGFFEKWQHENGFRKASQHFIFRYRFGERWRYVWYGAVLLCVLGMILYILGIALMFDQNPQFYCLGSSTTSWLVDFIVPYLINTFVIEPCKVLFIIGSKNAMRKAASHANRLRLEGTEMSEMDAMGKTEDVQELPVEAS